MILRAVKSEIRVIGLVAIEKKDSIHLIGVIYRGSKWLDGVISSITQGPKLTIPLIELIKKSKHYQQIRVITIHSDYFPKDTHLDLELLYEKLNKPIIYLTTKELDDTFKWKDIRVKPIGLKKSKVEQVLKITAKNNYIPEALRIAYLIKKRFPKTARADY